MALLCSVLEVAKGGCRVNVTLLLMSLLCSTIVEEHQRENWSRDAICPRPGRRRIDEQPILFAATEAEADTKRWRFVKQQTYVGVLRCRQQSR